jgi:hypothetical protein
MARQDAQPTGLNRTVAAHVALAAVAALVLQFRVALDAPGRPVGVPVWWWLGGYFTGLTNLAVAGALTAIALGWRPTAQFSAGLVLAILMVGVVYHLILASLWHPEGPALWADQGLHSAVPALSFA